MMVRVVLFWVLVVVLQLLLVSIQLISVLFSVSFNLSINRVLVKLMLVRCLLLYYLLQLMVLDIIIYWIGVISWCSMLMMKIKINMVILVFIGMKNIVMLSIVRRVLVYQKMLILYFQLVSGFVSVELIRLLMQQVVRKVVNSVVEFMIQVV